MKSTSNTAMASPLVLGIAIAAGLAVTGCAQQADASAAEGAAIEESAPSSSIRDVSVAKADALIADAAVTVLDVRTPGEFAEGHIEGAVNVDLRAEDFAEQLAKLDPDQTYLLHCKSGARSAQALEVMKEQGFDDVAHMNDGFDAWAASGKAVAR